jgi:hypothetical protein
MAKNRATASFFMAALLALPACGPQPSEPPPPGPWGTVHGRLVSAASPDATNGALCTLEGVSLSTTTGADGTFTFTGVDVGPFTLLCRKSAASGRPFSLLRRGAVPGAGQTLNLGDLELRASGALSGVVRQFGWEDSSGIRVAILGTSLATVTDTQGRFVLEGVPEGTHQPAYNKEGFGGGVYPQASVQSGETTVLPDAVLMAPGAATGTLTLADGRGASRSRTVSVTLSASPGTTLYQLSEHPGFTGAPWKPLTAQAEWTFGADGPQRLYVRFADAQGRVGPFAEARLLVDTQAPEGTLRLQGGGGTRGTRAITLELTARDELSTVTSMRVGDSAGLESAPWEPLAATRAWTLADTEGAQDLLAQFLDAVGNVSAPVPLTVVLDRTPPGNPRLFIGHGGFTRTAEVGLNVLADGASEVAFSGDGDFDPDAWREYGSYLGTFRLSPGDGVKTVYARFRDAVGNVGEPISQQVVLDTQPPSAPVPDTTSSWTTSDTYYVVLAEPARDANFGYYMVRSSGGVPYSRTDELDNFRFTFPAEGTYVLEVVAVDLAGNESAAAYVVVRYDTTPAALP